MSIKSKLTLKEMAIIAILLACSIILSRFFSISTPITKISFSFVPLIISGRYFGTKGAMIVAGLGDLIGALLFPFGVYFPGYTLSEILRGYILGKSFRKINLSRIVIAIILTQIVCSLALNSLSMTIFYENFRAFSLEKFISFIVMRTPQVAVMIVAQIAVSIPLLIKGEKIFTKIIKN